MRSRLLPTAGACGLLVALLALTPLGDAAATTVRRAPFATNARRGQRHPGLEDPAQPGPRARRAESVRRGPPAGARSRASRAASGSSASSPSRGTAGFVCIDPHISAGTTSGFGWGAFCACGDAAATGDGSRYGFIVQVNGGGPGLMTANGVWVYAAP
jgi:hypothetical protein